MPLALAAVQALRASKRSDGQCEFGRGCIQVLLIDIGTDIWTAATWNKSVCCRVWFVRSNDSTTPPDGSLGCLCGARG